MSKIKVLYNKASNSLLLPVLLENILPTFLYYLLEYHKIPQDATLVFLDKKVRLVKSDDEFKYEEVK